MPRTRAGVRHVMRVPEVRDLAAQPRLIVLASSFIGSGPIPFRVTLFDKSATANWLVAWHQDTALPLQRRSANPAWGPWSIKSGVLHAIAPATALTSVVALRVHLDDSTRTNGPLRVLPGTHADGILSRDEIRRRADRVTPVECLASAGDVVAIRPLVVHASSKASDGRPRRVLHIEYAAAIHIGPDIELAVGQQALPPYAVGARMICDIERLLGAGDYVQPQTVSAVMLDQIGYEDAAQPT